MNLAALALTSGLGIAAVACGTEPARTVTPPAPSAAVASSTGDPGLGRPGLPAVDGDDRRVIPRVDGNDAAPPISTRTTVLESNRPALVVTLPEAVLFAFGSAELRGDADAPLHSVMELVARHPGGRVDVAGYTDSIGSAEYNLLLSQLRAAAVADWLAVHGVPRASLRPAGYGAMRPIVGNATEEDRRRNRRVEITVETTEKERSK